MKYKSLIILILLSLNTYANSKQDVPTSLFGIELGKHYDIGDGIKSNGNLPVKKFTGLNKFLGEGFHYYFEPLKDYKMFNYKEKRKKKNSKFFETSFSLYIFPVIQDNIKSLSELKNAKQINYEVAGIRWSDGYDEKDTKDNRKKNYYWAKEFCATFSLDIKQEPEITNYYEDGWFRCSFNYHNRILEINGDFSRSISLDYSKEKFDNKHKSIRDTIRLLYLKENKPY